MDARHPEGRGIYVLIWCETKLSNLFAESLYCFFQNVRLSNRLRMQKHHFRLPSVD